MHIFLWCASLVNPATCSEWVSTSAVEAAATATNDISLGGEENIFWITTPESLWAQWKKWQQQQSQSEQNTAKYTANWFITRKLRQYLLKLNIHPLWTYSPRCAYPHQKCMLISSKMHIWKCSQQLCSSWPEAGNNPNVHQQENEKINLYIHIIKYYTQ